MRTRINSTVWRYSLLLLVLACSTKSVDLTNRETFKKKKRPSAPPTSPAPGSTKGDGSRAPSAPTPDAPLPPETPPPALPSSELPEAPSAQGTGTQVPATPPPSRRASNSTISPSPSSPATTVPSPLSSGSTYTGTPPTSPRAGESAHPDAVPTPLFFESAGMGTPPSSPGADASAHPDEGPSSPEAQGEVSVEELRQLLDAFDSTTPKKDDPEDTADAEELKKQKQDQEKLREIIAECDAFIEALDQHIKKIQTEYAQNILELEDLQKAISAQKQSDDGAVKENADNATWAVLWQQLLKSLDAAPNVREEGSDNSSLAVLWQQLLKSLDAALNVREEGSDNSSLAVLWQQLLKSLDIKLDGVIGDSSGEASQKQSREELKEVLRKWRDEVLKIPTETRSPDENGLAGRDGVGNEEEEEEEIVFGTAATAP